MARFTGRSAEKRFSTLCSDLGITCNESVEDERGWDHIVELRHEPVPGVSMDMQYRVPPIFVQTKSHESDALSISMKLSNAVNLARSPDPCFVVLMSLAPDSVTPTWHAVHVWGSLLERIMKRVREESRDGLPDDAFHTRTFSFTMTAEDRRDERDLLPWIEHTVRAVGPDYSIAKTALSPPPVIVGEIKIGPLGSIGELVDHMLGLTKHIPMSDITIGQRRFGVDIPLPMPTGDIAYASLQSHPADRCDIRLRGPDGIVLEMVGDVIAPPDIGLPEESVRYRFRAPNLDIVWSSVGEATINGHLDFQKLDTPNAIEKALLLMSWAGQGPIDVRIDVRDEPILGATAQINPIKDRQAFADLAVLTGTLVRLSRHLRTKMPMVTIAQIDGAEHLIPFHDFVRSAGMRMTVEMPDDAIVPDASTGVGFGILPVGGWIFAAVQRFPIIHQHREGRTWTIEYGGPVLLDAFAFPVGDAETLEHFQDAYRRSATAPGAIALDNVPLALEANIGTEPAG